jgi:flavorubredoxin
MMALLTHEISVSDPKNKVLGIFGGSSWNGSGSKALRAFAEKMKMDVVGDNAEFLGRPFASDMEQLDAFAKEFVAQLRK